MEPNGQHPAVPPNPIWEGVTFEDANVDALWNYLAGQVREYAAGQSGFTVIEEMLAERVVTLYAGMRAKEAEAGKDSKDPWDAYAHDRSWKELHQQLQSMASTVQKSVGILTGSEATRSRVEEGMLRILNEVLSSDDIDKTVAMSIRMRMADMLDKVKF